MKIYSVFDKEFAPYGKVIEGFDVSELLAAMEKIALPESGVAYEPAIPSLEACTAVFDDMRDHIYGGMPVQIGMCWGHNTKLNCLEYHRDSEINIGTGDFVLLVAKAEDVVDWKLDTSKVMAFKAPAGAMVECYATTLHYAPCHINASEGFRVAVVLPRGTNTAKPEYQPKSFEDKLLTARNKWLIAHADADEAKNGAYVGLVGENIDIA